MLHVRVVTPSDRQAALVGELEANLAICNIVVMPGAARRPAGDLVQFDVAREAANGVLERLRQLDLHRVGSIAVDRIDTALSDVAAAAEAHAPGEPSEAVIWEEVEARVRGDSGLSPSFVALLVIAVLIGAVGVLVDSPILIVGAMVVGPEYGPLASVAMGLYGCRLRRVRRGLVALAVGFPVAIVAAASLTVVLRWADRIPLAYQLGERPLTNFISNPDLFAIIVAVLAGVAGTVSLTEARSGALVGVLISVTTIPAASNVGVALAMSRVGEAAGALGQLILNLGILVVVGAVTLRLQARLWLRLAVDSDAGKAGRVHRHGRTEAARTCLPPEPR